MIPIDRDLQQTDEEMTLNAEYYTLDSSFSNLADVDFDGAPTATGSVDDLNINRTRDAFWEGGAKNYFAARYHGFLNVDEGGEYTFFLKSDSNAMLFIDGKPIAENLGGKGGRKSQITLDLDPGAHEIEIRYFDAIGRSTLQLEWQGPDSGGAREFIGGDSFSAENPDIEAGQETGSEPASDTADDTAAEPPADEEAPADTSGDTVAEESGSEADPIPQDESGDSSADDSGSVDQGAGDSGDQSDHLDHQEEDNGTTGDQVDSTETVQTQQGLQASYFVLPYKKTSVRDIDFDATPSAVGSVDQLSFMGGYDPFWSGGPEDLFAAKYAGNLNIKNAGTYTFFLTSDDGSALYIDGVPVIDNDGLHSTREQLVTVDLSEGAHEIEVRYFEAYGKATLQLEWTGPDSDGVRNIIGGDALSYGYASAPADDTVGDSTGDTGTVDDTAGDGHGDHGTVDDTVGDSTGDTGTVDDTAGDGHGDHGTVDDTVGDSTGDTGTVDDTAGDGHGDHGTVDDTVGDSTGDTGTVDDTAGDGHGDHGTVDDTVGDSTGDTGTVDDTTGDGHGDHGTVDDTVGDTTGDTGTVDDTAGDGHGDHGTVDDTTGDSHGDHSSDGGHNNHSDGHVPPPTSPDQVEAYVAAVRAQEDGHAHGDDAGKATEHMELLDLVPRSEATHIAIGDGDWFDPGTWYEGRIPDAGSHVLIPEGISVTYAGESDESLFSVRVDGELSFAHDANSKILIDTMVVSPTGRLEIGTEENPISQDVDVEIVIANNGDIDTGWDPMLLSRGVISHGSVEIHGAEKTSFVTVADAPMAGDTEITLSEIPEGWQVGDTIVLTGTHKQGWFWDQSAGAVVHHESEDEEVVITAIDGNTITLDRALEHNHDAPRDDLAAYVANTTRNVTFSSEDGEDTATHHRGHTMFMHSDDVDVRYAAFDDLGRTDKSEPAFNVTTLDSVQSDTNIQSRYPFHFHRTGTEDQENPAIAIGNTVSGSPGWGYAHHDSHAIMTDNVAFDIFGAAFVAEDGNETGVWSHNIAIRTEGVSYGESEVKLQSDVDRHDNGRTGEGYFFAGRLVEASDNVAANTTHGFVWMTRGHPRDPLSDNLDQPEIAYGNEYLRLDQPAIQGFQNNEAFGTEVGLIVIKNGPDQNHDIRSVMDGFLNWETARGVDLSYSSHYTLIDFDLLATQSGGFQYPEIGFQLGGNAFDIVANGLTIEGFVNGANLDQSFHFGNNGADYDDVFIDVQMINVGNEFVGFNSARHSIMTSDDLVAGRLGFVLDSDTVISEGEDFSLGGLKTDSIGSRDREFAGDPQILYWHEDIAQFIANEGYYTTSTGQNVLVIEDFVADRATGELLKLSHVVTLDMSVQQIENSWSINYWGGAQYNGVIEFDGVGPTTQNDSASTTSGEGVLIDVLANDSHAAGDDLRVDGLSTTPNGSVYVQEDGQLLYVPNPDFIGTDTFNYWAADDDGEFTQATVTVEVFDL